MSKLFAVAGTVTKRDGDTVQTYGFCWKVTNVSSEAEAIGLTTEDFLKRHPQHAIENISAVDFTDEAYDLVNQYPRLDQDGKTPRGHGQLGEP